MVLPVILGQLQSSKHVFFCWVQHLWTLMSWYWMSVWIWWRWKVQVCPQKRASSLPCSFNPAHPKEMVKSWPTAPFWLFTFLIILIMHIYSRCQNAHVPAHDIKPIWFNNTFFFKRDVSLYHHVYGKLGMKDIINFRVRMFYSRWIPKLSLSQRLLVGDVLDDFPIKKIFIAHRIRMYGRLMLTWLGYIDGKCYR